MFHWGLKEVSYPPDSEGPLYHSPKHSKTVLVMLAKLPLFLAEHSLLFAFPHVIEHLNPLPTSLGSLHPVSSSLLKCGTQNWNPYSGCLIFPAWAELGNHFCPLFLCKHSKTGLALCKNLSASICWTPILWMRKPVLRENIVQWKRQTGIDHLNNVWVPRGSPEEITFCSRGGWKMNVRVNGNPSGRWAREGGGNNACRGREVCKDMAQSGTCWIIHLILWRDLTSWRQRGATSLFLALDFY